MDLHDYTDVAENYDLYLDEMYKNEDNHAGFQLHIFPANMTEFKSDRKYSAAIIARSGFMHLTTPELQRAALINIHENMTDGGMLTFNTFDPHPFFRHSR